MAKKVGSKLKSRIIPEQSIVKWEERALRKVEMEFAKAENMIEHRDEIYARPKRTWFMTEKEKKLVAKAERDSAGNPSGNELISADIAEDLKMKEKRKREHEKNLPRKKRRKLEAAGGMLEDNEEEEEKDEKRGRSRGKGKKKDEPEKKGLTLVDLGYRRAKAVKAKQRAIDSGKMERSTPNKKQNQNWSKPKNQPRNEEMKDLVKSDMNEKKTSGEVQELFQEQGPI